MFDDLVSIRFLKYDGLTLGMRDVDIIVLRQIREAVQAITRNSDYFCTSGNSTIFKVLTNDIKNSSF
jgi:hypothetical protein